MTGSESAEYLYVISFDNTDEEWDTNGAEPWLSAIGGGYIYTIVLDEVESWFLFANTARSVADYLLGVILEIYCKKDVGGGNQRIKVYSHDGVGENYEGQTTDIPEAYAWKTLTLTFIDTWAKIDACRIKLKKFHYGSETVYLYVDSFGADVGWNDWDTSGASPYLSNGLAYINTDVNNEKMGFFGFADISGWLITEPVNLVIEAKGDGNDTIQIDLYDGSAWHNNIKTYAPNIIYTNEFTDVTAILNSEAKINAAKIRFTYIGSGAANQLYVRKAWIQTKTTGARTVYVDAMRLKVRYYEGGQEICKDPTAFTDGGLPWTNPAKGLTLDGQLTETSIVAHKEDYTNYDFPPIDVVYRVNVHGWAKRSAVGIPDVMRFCVSTDGGASWQFHTQPLTAILTEYIIGFTADFVWTGAKMTDANLQTRIWAGSTGCLVEGCEVPLWIEDKAERISMKDCPTFAKIEKLWSNFETIHNHDVKRMPPVLAFEDGKFMAGNVLDFKIHYNVKCYRIVVKSLVEGVEYLKDSEVSATQPVWGWFKGKITAEDLELGDIIGGLFWDEKKKDYMLRPMEVIEKKGFMAKKVYQLIIDKKHMFAHKFLKIFIKW